MAGISGVFHLLPDALFLARLMFVEITIATSAPSLARAMAAARNAALAAGDYSDLIF